jgi:hypothetical protein
MIYCAVGQRQAHAQRMLSNLRQTTRPWLKAFNHLEERGKVSAIYWLKRRMKPD